MILVCGEALYDLFGEETPSGLAFDARIGGSPFNVAVGLARLGLPVAYFGGLSRDMLGRRLQAALAAEGVDLTHVALKDAPTTLSLVGVGPDGSPAYSFYGIGAADRMVTSDDLPDLGEDCAAVHIGSFSTLVEPVGDSLLALVKRESSRRVIAYDPNVRPTVVPEMERWRARLDALLPHVHILKISAEDMASLYPGTDAAAVATDWLDRGPRLIVVTRGSEGAEAFAGGRRVAVPGRNVAVVDTVGAGDTFQAALLTALADRGLLAIEALSTLDEATLAQALTFAAAAAAITCARRGADLPTRADLAATSSAA